MTIPRSRLTARPPLCNVATASSGLAPMQLTTALLRGHLKGSVEGGGTLKAAALQRSCHFQAATTTPKRQDTGSPSIARSHPRPPQRSAAQRSAFLITVGRGAGAGCDMALWREDRGAQAYGLHPPVFRNPIKAPFITSALWICHLGTFGFTLRPGSTRPSCVQTTITARTEPATMFAVTFNVVAPVRFAAITRPSAATRDPLVFFRAVSARASQDVRFLSSGGVSPTGRRAPRLPRVFLPRFHQTCLDPDPCCPTSSPPRFRMSSPPRGPHFSVCHLSCHV